MFIDVVNGADVWMVERRGSLRFTLESFQGLPVLREVLRQELQGDGTLELRVLGLIDDTHAAATELLHDAIVGKGPANHARNQTPHAILGRACG